MSARTGAKPLADADLDRMRKEFSADPDAKVLQNALTAAEVNEIALDRETATSIDPSMSVLLDDWKVTDQKQSGRCWLFAGLNLLRPGASRKMNLKNFEFSQNHAMFFDKVERANYFLHAIAETADRESDDRTVARLLDDCCSDGGQWNMFAAVIAKHGVVPKSAMPETVSSSRTGPLNSSLRKILHTAARDIRIASDREQRQQLIEKTLSVVWRTLCLHLGTPPERFFWQWTDEDKNFHRDGWLTPAEFRDTYVDLDLDSYVCLVHDPRATSPTGQTYTVDMLGNVVDAPPVTYLNVDIDLMKQLTRAQLETGTPVWFGCDVGQQMNKDLGIWDANLINLGPIYGFDFDLDKADRLEYHQTLMTHAMLFTGVDVADDQPRKWRVENSWGDDKGQDGFYTMTDSWFDEYVFEIAAPKSMLPADLVAALDQEPSVLPAWDPMGALAR